jgi:hypothetical protein
MRRFLDTGGEQIAINKELIDRFRRLQGPEDKVSPRSSPSRSPRIGFIISQNSRLIAAEVGGLRFAVVHNWVRSGRGKALKAVRDVQPDLEAGALIECLSDFFGAMIRLLSNTHLEH